MMQLPPFLIPNKSAQPSRNSPSSSASSSASTQQQQSATELAESDQFKFIKNLNSLCGHGFWFSVGVSIAHISRIASAPVGSGAVIVLAGFLLIVQPKNPTPYLLSMRRISGLLMLVGTAIAFWDALWLFATLPLGVAVWVVPLWQFLVPLCLSIAIVWRWQQ